MASGVMTEAILTIAVVIAASTAAAIFMQSAFQLNDVQMSAVDSAKDTASTMIKVVFATNSSPSQVKVWIKNLGLNQIESSQLQKADIFFGPRGNYSLIPYGKGSPPGWSFTLINDADSDSRFDPGETLEVTLDLSYEVTGGDYYFRFTSYNGVNGDYYFAV